MVRAPRPITNIGGWTLPERVSCRWLETVRYFIVAARDGEEALDFLFVARIPADWLVINQPRVVEAIQHSAGPAYD